MDGIIMPK